MKVIIQRVSEGGVYIDKENYNAEIGKGYVILLGIKTGDTIEDALFLAEKCYNLRVFEDANDKMNLSLSDISGEVLIISQFTLYGDAQKGNRPSFSGAARPERAVPLYEAFINRMKTLLGEEKVKTGIFGAMMQVKIFNDGPVTIEIRSKEKT